MSLALLAEAAGWPAIERSESLCAVQLATATPVTALLSPQDGSVRALVEVATLEGAPPSCIEAVSALLFLTAGVVRFVRPAFEAGKAWIEVAFPAAPDAEQLHDGLAALSIACRMAAREAALLATDEILAADFLALRSRTGPQLHTNSKPQKTK